MTAISKNKGEWAELFLLYNLLGSGLLKITNPSDKSKSVNVRIKSILREIKPGALTTFSLNNGNVSFQKEGNRIDVIPQYEFLLNSEKVRNDIVKRKGPAFLLSDKSNFFMEKIGMETPKAKSLKTTESGLPVGGKNDILITYENPTTGTINTTGFSIKSSFAHPATLQNGTKLTNFKYQITGLNERQINEINGLCQKRLKKNGEATADVISRCNKIREYGAEILPVGIESTKDHEGTFERNLMMIDMTLPSILSDLVYIHYFDKNHPVFLSEFPPLLAKLRPIQDSDYDTSFYERKIKDYLFACFAGMVPGTPWKGKTDLEGGYLIIDRNFDIYGCLSTETEAFKDYLFSSTRLEHSDGSPRRANYGKIFSDLENKFYINLNLQVRFSKSKDEEN